MTGVQTCALPISKVDSGMVPKVVTPAVSGAVKKDSLNEHGLPVL